MSRTLADAFLANSHGGTFSGYMRRARRFVLDDRAARLAVGLSNQFPKPIAALIPVGWPPESPLWFEWPTEVVMRERERMGTLMLEGPRPPRLPFARTGALCWENDDGTLEITCIEHPETGLGNPIIWPVGFRLFREPFRDDDPNMVARAWGYGQAIDVSPLMGRGIATIQGRLAALRQGEDYARRFLGELAGFLRLTVGIMALTNTVADVGPNERPPGRFIGGGGTRPYVDRALVSVTVPRRVVDPVRWVQREAPKFHKRLHEVRGFYRHLKHEPMTRGWEHIEHPQLGWVWRKAIASHLRGNPDLGVVEHSGFELKGS